MCGIVAKIKRQPDENKTAEQILAMFDLQKTRGQRGVGYLSFNDEVTAYVRRQTPEEIKDILEKNESRSIIFHHRMPTSTPNYSDCTHPILVSHKELKHDYYLVHNGMISNDTILHDEHIALGYEYITTVESITKTQNHSFSEIEFNDSEALAIDVARFIEGKQTELKSQGSIAFICAQVNKKTGKVLRIFFGRNSNPLTYDFNDDSLTLRSEGGTESIEPNKLYSLTLSNWGQDISDVKIGTLMSSRNHNWHNGGWDVNDDRYGIDPSMYRVTDPDREDQLTRFMNRSTTPTVYQLPERAGIEVIDVTGEDITLDGMPQLTMYQDEELRKIDTKMQELEEEQSNLIDDIKFYKEAKSYDMLTPMYDRQREIEKLLSDLDAEKDMIMEGTFGT